MKENGIAKTLQIIGYVELIAATILNLFFDSEDIFGFDLSVGITIGAFITCVVFQGFAEIIDLLYKNGKKQDEIVELLKERHSKENNTPKTVLQDIESNLPEM